MNQLNDKDKAGITQALIMFRDKHCGTKDCRARCDELIMKVKALSLADPDPDSPMTRVPCRWDVGATLRHKRHGWEGVIVAPLQRVAGLINVDVGCGIKVGEHVSDWDFVCGPDGETEEGT